MDRTELIKLHEETCHNAREIMKSKNQDYAGGTLDPFHNFTASEIFGVPAPIGILMRSLDKFMRIVSFVTTGKLHVATESVYDAIDDVINYMILLKGYIISKSPKK